MRPSIRHIGVLVACLSAGIAVAAGAADAPKASKAGNPDKPAKRGKRGPVQQEADAFLATVTGLLDPVSTSAIARRLGGRHRRHARARRAAHRRRQGAGRADRLDVVIDKPRRC